VSLPPPAIEPLARWLRLAHRGVLGLLIGCALGIVARGFGGEEPPPDRVATSAAVGLALGCIVLRRLAASPVIRTRTAHIVALACLALAAALGPLGIALALSHDAPRSGLVYCVAGLIFSLRRPDLAAGDPRLRDPSP
jgi:hypothetical protein